jgi:hypothetical protein
VFYCYVLLACVFFRVGLRVFGAVFGDFV